MEPSFEQATPDMTSMQSPSQSSVQTMTSHLPDPPWLDHAFTMFARQQQASDSEVAMTDLSGAVLGAMIPKSTLGSDYTLPTIKDDGREPSLSLPQLIIMALVLNGRTLSMDQICDWINLTFKYYRDQTLRHSLSGTGGACTWVEQADAVLHQFDFPTTPMYHENDGQHKFHLVNGSEWYVLNPSKKSKRPFPLMHLPIELRLKIYHHILYYPLPKRRGWAIDPEYTAGRHTLFKQAPYKPQHLIALGPGGFILRTPTLDRVLALLQVNQQVHAEATPVFYRSNFFYFDSALTLNSFLTGMPLRYQFVRNVVLKYDPPQIDHKCTRTFKILAKTKIRNLHLIVYEKELMDRLIGCANIGQLPGLKELGKLRGLDLVTFQGEYHGISRFLFDSGITKTKPGDKLDDDEKAARKLEADQKTYVKAILRATKELARRRKREAKQAEQAELKEERAEKKRLQLEAKAVKAAQRTALKKQKQQEKNQTYRLHVQQTQDKMSKRKADAAKARVARAQYTMDAKAHKDAIAASRSSKGKGKHIQAKRKKRDDSSSEPVSSTEEGPDSDSDGPELPPPKKKKSTVPSMAATGRAVSKHRAQAKSKSRMFSGKAVSIKQPSGSSTTEDASATDSSSDSETIFVKKTKIVTNTENEKAKELGKRNANLKAKTAASFTNAPAGKCKGQGSITLACVQILRKPRSSKKCTGDANQMRGGLSTTPAPAKARVADTDGDDELSDTSGAN